MTSFMTTQQHLDRLPDEKLLDCLELVVGFQVFDFRVETWKRRREAEELIRRIKARKEAGKSVPYDEARRFLRSVAGPGFSEVEAAQFLSVQP